MNQRYLIISACALAAITAYSFLKPVPPQTSAGPAQTETPAQGRAMVLIEMPELTGKAILGQRVFETACAFCHGINAAGTLGTAPPLIHKIYEPSHHGDEAFQRAAKLGVKSHHWLFGDMPPVDGLTRDDVAMVVEYIRQIQRANGIN